MNKVFTVSIIGCGSRGCDAYGKLFHEQKERFRIVSLCELREERLSRFGREYGVSQENLFTDENLFFQKKRSDALVIATQDKDHVRMCLRAMELGYTVLLEKPITPDKQELEKLLEAKKRYNGRVLVCHVLRYAPAFVKVKELLKSGAIGRLVLIEAIEQVSFWHQAHSYVRGNWRREETTSPMLLAKCCHDLDLLQYYAASEAETVYSVGDLAYFTAENKPEGAAVRCADCKYIDTCPYSAEYVYIKRWKECGRPKDDWPFNIIAPAPNTEENLREAYRKGPYGRCVFDCDNDVVDHQTVSIRFRNNVKAQLIMTAFTYDSGRRMYFHGTDGEIKLDEAKDTLLVERFGQPIQEFKISDIVTETMKDSFGHGGGDYGTVDAFYELLCGQDKTETSLEKSAESHFISYAAEESRKKGAAVQMSEFRTIR